MLSLTITSSRSAWPCSSAPAQHGCEQRPRADEAGWRCGTVPGCGRPSVGQDGAEGEACWSRMGAEAAAWWMRGEVAVAEGKRMGVEVGAFELRMGVEVGASELRMGVEVGAFERRMGGEVEAFERRMGGEVEAFGRTSGGVVGTSERTGEVGEACEMRHGEEEEEELERSLGVEGEAKGKKTSEGEVVGEGMRTAEEGEAEGKKKWGEVGEAALLLLLHCRWLRRSRVSPFSSGASGNPGND